MAGNRKRWFGNVRQRPSGRWQARYRGPDGRMRSAPYTFQRKAEAERYLVIVEAQLTRGEWADPQRAKVKLRDYGQRWIEERANLRPRTVQLYRWLFGKHIEPHLGGVALGQLETPLIREWRAKLLSEGVSIGMTAKAYRLLRAILMTAVNEDRILVRNPCRVPGADRESPAERPVLTFNQVLDLAATVPTPYRAMILVTAMASLWYGEVIALQRMDVDELHGTVRVRQAFSEIRGDGMVLGPPKSRAGARSISLPGFVQNELRRHLDEFVAPDPTSLVFTGPTGAPIRRGNFNDLTRWSEAVARIGVPELHFHDLRHTGNTLAASSRVSTRDLMTRMGHDSMNAALIYQHATSEADRAIADSLEARFMAHKDDKSDDSPTSDDGPNEPNDEAG
jgi:integrase